MLIYADNNNFYLSAMSFPRLLDLLYRGLGLARHATQDEPLPSFGNPSRKEWLAIITLAEKNEVSGLAYDAMLTLPPEQRPDNEVIMQWTALIQSMERDNLLLRQRSSAVIDQLAQQGLSPIILKGLSLSDLYPNPLHRPVGDIDLYVPLDQQHRYVECLTQLGGKVSEGYDAKHVTVACQGLNWELHFRTHYFYSVRFDRRYHLLEMEESTPDSLFHQTIEGHSMLVFPPLLHMVYMTAHFQHHLLVGEFSFRQVVDWVLALRHDRTALAISEVAFVRTLRQLGLYRLYRALGYIASKHLGCSADGYAGLSNLSKSDKRHGELLLRILRMGRIPGCKPHRAQLPTDTFMMRLENYWQLCRRCQGLFRLFPAEAFLTPFGFLAHAIRRRRADRKASRRLP